MDRALIASLLLVASILQVIGFYFIGSAIKPGYSQLSNFVSEYNATGSAWATALTYAGYVTSGLLLSSFLIAATPLMTVSGASRVGLHLLWSIPASFLLSVVAPCDLGCPLEGSPSQEAHNLLAVVAYVGMGVGIALVSMDAVLRGYRLRRAFMLLTGMAFPVVFVIMLESELAPWRGLIQRGLDLALAISLVLMVWTFILEGRGARLLPPSAEA